MSWRVFLDTDFIWMLIAPPLFIFAFACALARLTHPRNRDARRILALVAWIAAFGGVAAGMHFGAFEPHALIDFDWYHEGQARRNFSGPMLIIFSESAVVVLAALADALRERLEAPERSKSPVLFGYAAASVIGCASVLRVLDNAALPIDGAAGVGFVTFALVASAEGAFAYKAFKERDWALCISALLMFVTMSTFAFFDKPAAGIFALPLLIIRFLNLRMAPGQSLAYTELSEDIEQMNEELDTVNAHMRSLGEARALRRNEFWLLPDTADLLLFMQIARDGRMRMQEIENNGGDLDIGV